MPKLPELPNPIRLAALLIAALVATAALSAGLGAARAVAAPADIPFNVTSTQDAVDAAPGDGVCQTAALSPAAGACTLRAAVMEADKTSGAGATIHLPAGTYSLTIPADITDAANTGDLNLTAPAVGSPPISIQGAGAASTIIDGNGLDRVWLVEAGRTASISGVTVRGGFLNADFGAGIKNSGQLDLYRVTISNNLASGAQGGGLENFGVMTVTESTIGPDNVAEFCGGLCNDGNLWMQRSTVQGNRATASGGGIYNDPGTSLVLIDSTVSQNTAGHNGGGIANTGAVNIYNTSIISNVADTGFTQAYFGGGVYNQGGIINGHVPSFALRNSLLVKNTVGNVNYDDCFGTLQAYGNNLFSTPISCTIVQNGGGLAGEVNHYALIGPLANNGGPTLTHALLPGSNAIDGGDPTFGCTDFNGDTIATDQRGIQRALGARCDIGAVESLPIAAFLPFLQR